MSKESRFRRYFVAGSTMGALLWAAQAAHAQDSSAASGPPEEIIVTGSRVRQLIIDTPNPTVSIDAESIELSGTTDLTDYLTNQPALVGSMDSTQTTGAAGFIGSSGLSLLNLRNLGTDRTLVLVDGRRHVAQLPETAAVDINTIPIDLVDHIDIATGGVSAVYGADAVSGVVNFVMKKDFEGLLVRSQFGQPIGSEGGKPVNWFTAVTGGFNFAGGRGNLSGSIEHVEEGRLRAIDREYLRGTNYRTLQRNPLDEDDDPNVPDRIPLANMRFFDSSHEGAIDVDFDGVPDFRPSGAPYEITNFIPPFYTQGGTGTLLADYIGDLLSEDENTVTSAFLHFELTESMNLFAEAKYAHGKSFSASQPTFDYGWYIREDNPFMPAAIRAQVPANRDGVLVNRDNFDFGVRGENNTRDTWRSVLGVEGDISSGLHYEVSYVYGQTEVDNVSTNNRFNDRLFAALDVMTNPANGQPICRSNLDPSSLLESYHRFDYSAYGPGELSFTPGPNSGCVPLNIMGEGAPSRAAVDWIMTDSLATSKIKQNVATAFVTGDLPVFELPAGAIGFAVGAEWRREESQSTPPAEDIAGLTFGNVIFPTDGDFSVKEVFTEVRLPILKDQAWADLLQLTAAVRFSDYTTVGNTTTWNVGTTWSPVSDIMVRGTLAQSVRAPNISELFSPQSETFEFIDDPCDVTRLNNGSQYRAANCAAILSALGVDPSTFTDANSSNISGTQRGNETLSEETADSWTIGAVFRPRFISGFSFAVDLYDIKIKDAISTPEPQTLADNCVDQPSINNVFCAGLTRDPAEDGLITGFVIQPENVAFFRTRGVDFNINYEMQTDGRGTFGVLLGGNYLNKLLFIETPGADIQDDRTTQYAPMWQSTLDLSWSRGPLLINYGFNFFSETKRYSLANLAGDPDFASPANIEYDARQTHDVQVRLNMLENVRIYAGVNNITNEKPDLDTVYPVSPVGRFLYLGAKFTFDNN